MQAPPEQMRAKLKFSPELSTHLFLPHDAKLSHLLNKVHLFPCYELEAQFSPLLVMHESSKK
jgi:hypothetical protein